MHPLELHKNLALTWIMIYNISLKMFPMRMILRYYYHRCHVAELIKQLSWLLATSPFWWASSATNAWTTNAPDRSPQGRRACFEISRPFSAGSGPSRLALNRPPQSARTAQTRGASSRCPARPDGSPQPLWQQECRGVCSRGVHGPRVVVVNDTRGRSAVKNR